MIIFLPLLVAAIGLFMWFVSANPKYTWLGLGLALVGIHAFLVAGGGQAIGLLGK